MNRPLIDKGFIYANDNSRIFLNSCLGCVGGCTYCYLSKIGYDNNSKYKVKKAEDILEELYKSINIDEKTLITLGCFSECWDEENKKETLTFLRHFLTKGNQVQLSTKKRITFEDMKEIKDLIQYKGQFVVFVSSATIRKWASIEPNTDRPDKRFETFENLKALDIPVVLYMKPILQGVTIQDIDYYIEFIKKYGIRDVVVGSIFTEKNNSETVHFSSENKLFYNAVSDEEQIRRKLMQVCNVFTQSSKVMEIYKEKEFEE